MNKDLVIIGGGSAGLAAAISANDAGVKSIVILEKEAYLGGILLQCIHNGFGLHTFKEELTGPEYASRFEEEVIKRNIEVKVNTMCIEITQDQDGFIVICSSSNGVEKIKAKAVITSTGCGERTRGAITIPGDRCSGIMTAGLAQKYLNVDGYMIGKKIFILGSGDIGLIMARRLTLEGAKVLGVAELMPYSNGLNRNIVQCLNDFNIPLYLHHTIKEVIGKTRLEKVIIQEVNDKGEFIDGTEKEFECDTLLLSVGLIPNNPLLEKMNVKMHPRTKGPLVDNTMQTSIKGLFACGNSLHVHDLVDFVSAEANVAGASAAKYILGNLKFTNTINVLNGKNLNYILPQTINLGTSDQIKLNFRVRNPFKDCYIYIYQGNNIIKKIKKSYIIPSEMESITLDSALLNSTDDITVEVENE